MKPENPRKTQNKGSVKCEASVKPKLGHRDTPPSRSSYSKYSEKSVSFSKGPINALVLWSWPCLRKQAAFTGLQLQ